MTTKDEVKANLSSTRKELAEVLPRLNDSMADWAPSLGMRTVKGQLVEIASTEEAIVLRLQGKALDYAEVEQFYWEQPEMAALIGALNDLRARTLAFIEKLGEEGLAHPAKVSEDFEHWLDLHPASNAELLRYIARHEAYHAGQLTSYLWARGDDPYKW